MNPAVELRADMNRLRELRIAAGLTMEQLAVHAGLTRLTVSRLERADPATLARVSVGTLLAVAAVLGIAVTTLVPALGSAPPAPQRKSLS